MTIIKEKKRRKKSRKESLRSEPATWSFIKQTRKTGLSPPVFLY